ncbi:MAG: hypothetical protein L0206_16045, partial [Actinobacteria bacterium]|nr:hypothetical protein [Actinomycetota bacterium]
MLAHFRRRHAAAPPSLVRPGTGHIWSLAAGCWLCNGRADLATQAKLGEALVTGSSAWRHASAALDGFFAIAAGDTEGREVHVATDRTGTLHLYRARVDGCEVLSTSALVLGAFTGAGFDQVAVHEFLGTGSVFEGRSLFANVEKLPPGTVLRFRDGRLVERQPWWELRPLLWPGPEAGRSGDVPALAEALTIVIGRVLAGYPGAVLDLTGGFDTRVILGAALATGRPFRTVVTGPDGAGDVVAAGRLAREFGLRHTHLQPGLDYGARSPGDLHDALTLTDGEFEVAEYAGIAQVHSRLAGESG